MSDVARRGSRILLIVLLAAMTIAGGLVGWRVFGPSPTGSFDALDDVDQTMFRQLSAQFDAVATRPDEVWTDDWRFEEQPMVLLRASGDRASQWRHAFLVNMSGHVDTSGMRPVQLDALPFLGDVVVSATYGLTNPLNHLPANFDVDDVGGQPVLVMKYSEELLRGEAPSVSSDFPTFLIHEEFHTTAQQSWTYPEGDAPFVDGYPTSDEHLDLLRAELAAFDAAHEEGSGGGLSEIAADLVSLRLERERRWPQLAPEASLEKMEGTATYVERAAARIRGEASTLGRMTASLDHLRQQGQLQGLERDVFYDTGARLGAMLDVLAPDWKDRMADEGATPFSVAAEAVGVDTAPDAARLQELVERYDSAP